MNLTFIGMMLAMLIFLGVGGACQRGGGEDASPLETQAQGVSEGSPQEICPVMGARIDRDVYLDYQGKRIYFCCPGCDQQFLESPDKYLRQMEEQGVVLEDAPETPGS